MICQEGKERTEAARKGRRKRTLSREFEVERAEGTRFRLYNRRNFEVSNSKKQNQNHRPPPPKNKKQKTSTMSSALLARNAALSAAPARRAAAPRRGGPVKVVAQGDGSRVDRSSKRDVM